MDFLQLISLIAATVAMGLMAGILFAFANSVLPGLGRADDRTFVAGFQAIDRAITNPLFLTVFAGALVLTVLAAGLHLGPDDRPVLAWTGAALALYLVALAITGAVNVPLNNALQAAGDPEQMEDLPDVRAHFEARWVTWNLVRTLTTVAAFGCLIWALVQHAQ